MQRGRTPLKLPRTIVVCTIALISACGTEPLVYEDLAGTYRGTFTATEPGGAVFEGLVELTLAQTEGALSGPWEITGTISLEGIGSTGTTSGGGFSAEAPLGADPSFPAELAYSLCPQDVMGFSTSYDSSSGVLTLVGDLDIPSSSCRVLTSYPLTVSLTR